ncbi:PREDICTED: nucleolin-like [Acromyrmex echinatior]|uniref:RNA-binding protein 34 n=1 Tax=Acromyrmex echinatior TaxID=103372 RepID=F4WF40_ACREC|nr:PREDICTED: nucleolin-like [Acromyrmex echinatior]EGI67091.1 RNA-binding protein 34 [Acromyrmex echinatior]
MGKVKALKHNANKGKQQLHEIKGGSVKKNKDSKFKNTSKDQKPVPNKKISKKYWDQKSSPNKKQNFKQSKNSNKAQKIDKKTFNSKKVEKQLDKSDSNTIESEDDSSNKSDETFESDSDIPDIFDKSLGEDDEDEDCEKDEEEEDTDSDDESDEEEMDDDDGSDEEEMSEHKGVKMFKGLQSKNKKNQKEDEIESNTTENTTESDDDDDEDNTDEDENKDKEKQKKKDNRITKNYAEILDLTSDSDYSNDTTDFSDDENAELGTKALLEQSIADDDDDEDFNGEDKDSSDEDDISSEVEEDSENDDVKKEANENENSIIRRFNITQQEKDDIAKRIVLIDNIPKTTPRAVIEKVCREHGKYQIFEAKPYPAFFLDEEEDMEQIEPLEWINRDYPHLETFSVNVLYSKRRSALIAVKYMHGLMFGRNFLSAVTADKIVQEPPHAVYITDLKKTMPDNCIWDMFNRCGFIMRFRNVRDSITGLSRGFGYVSFKTEDSVKTALTYSNEKIDGWRIKVMPYPYCEKSFVKKLEKETRQRNQPILENGKRILENDNRSSKKFKKSSGEPANVEPERNIKKQKKQEEDKKKSTAFQGQMVELKNKNKKNKLDKKNKKMAEKLAATSKKTKKN